MALMDQQRSKHHLAESLALIKDIKTTKGRRANPVLGVDKFLEANWILVASETLVASDGERLINTFPKK